MHILAVKSNEDRKQVADRPKNMILPVSSFLIGLFSEVAETGLTVCRPNMRVKQDNNLESTCKVIGQKQNTVMQYIV